MNELPLDDAIEILLSEKKKSDAKQEKAYDSYCLFPNEKDQIDWDTYSALSTALDMAIKALEQPEQQWIPCSERLPEEMGFYLVKVCAEYRPVRIYAFYPWDMDKERKYWINDSDSHSHVFNHFVEAWMPLPEPYREDDKE